MVGGCATKWRKAAEGLLSTDGDEWCAGGIEGGGDVYGGGARMCGCSGGRGPGVLRGQVAMRVAVVEGVGVCREAHVGRRVKEGPRMLRCDVVCVLALSRCHLYLSFPLTMRPHHLRVRVRSGPLVRASTTLKAMARWLAGARAATQSAHEASAFAALPSAWLVHAVLPCCVMGVAVLAARRDPDQPGNARTAPHSHTQLHSQLHQAAKAASRGALAGRLRHT